MAKIDIKKQEKGLYNPSAKQPSIVTVPTMTYFMVNGKGAPGNDAYVEAIELLYKASYSLKMGVVKKDNPDQDYVVPPLEGLWYMDDMTQWSMDNKEEWQWTMCIRIPDHVTSEQVDRALALIDPDEFDLDKLRVEQYEEGESVQILYFGPYDEEVETIAGMHAFAKQQGYQLHKHHHEIYLNDPRKVSPDKLKTVIRQPILKIE